jgi:hypothetical protein
LGTRGGEGNEGKLGWGWWERKGRKSIGGNEGRGKGDGNRKHLGGKEGRRKGMKKGFSEEKGRGREVRSDGRRKFGGGGGVWERGRWEGEEGRRKGWRRRDRAACMSTSRMNGNIYDIYLYIIYFKLLILYVKDVIEMVL